MFVDEFNLQLSCMRIVFRIENWAAEFLSSKLKHEKHFQFVILEIF